MGQGNWGGPKGQSVLVLLISTTISPLQGQLD
jgi:hypothetical protein